MTSSPSEPHFSRSTRPGWQLVLTRAASASSGNSLAIRPAPNSTPNRSGTSLLLSTAPSFMAQLRRGHGQLDGAGHHAQAFPLTFIDVILGV